MLWRRLQRLARAALIGCPRRDAARAAGHDGTQALRLWCVRHLYVDPRGLQRPGGPLLYRPSAARAVPSLSQRGSPLSQDETSPAPPPAAAWIDGGPGAGKTRLALRATAAAQRAGRPVIWVEPLALPRPELWQQAGACPAGTWHLRPPSVAAMVAMLSRLLPALPGALVVVDSFAALRPLRSIVAWRQLQRLVVAAGATLLVLAGPAAPPPAAGLLASSRLRILPLAQMWPCA